MPPWRRDPAAEETRQTIPAAASVRRALGWAIAGFSRSRVRIDPEVASPGPVVFAGNHLGHPDTILTLAAFERAGVHIRPVVATDGDVNRLDRWFLTAVCEVIWVDRRRNEVNGDGPMIEAIRRFNDAARQAEIDTLVRGGNVMIRPAGTYSPDIDDEPPYWTGGAVGVARAASDIRRAMGLTGVRIVPVIHEYDAKGRFHMKVEPEFDHTEHPDPHAATAALRQAIIRGRRELRGEHHIVWTPETYSAAWRRATRRYPNDSDYRLGYLRMRGYPTDPEGYRRRYEASDAFSPPAR
jgi:1-acyl-sn-glycerol-3-phosphate acyltransferase